MSLIFRVRVCFFIVSSLFDKRRNMYQVSDLDFIINKKTIIEYRVSGER